MNFPKQLTAAQRGSGKKRYRLFILLNGISVTCMMENIMILYALKNGLSDKMVAILSSLIFITMPFMFLGKQMVARIGVSRTFGICWALRYLFGLLLIVVPFLNTEMMPAAILLCAFGFFTSRSMGLIGDAPMTGEITTEKDRGQFISSSAMFFNITYLLSTFVVIKCLKVYDRISTYQYIILTGCIVGYVASYVVSTIPESRIPQESAQKPIGNSLRVLWGTPCYRRLIFAWSAVLISLLLVNPFAMLALKKGYLVADHNALFFALVGMLGSICATFVIGILSDYAGPRPILILSAVGLFFICAFWALAPPVFIKSLIMAVFFFGGFCTVGLQVGISHYFLSSIKEHERIGLSLLMQIFTGVTAGLTGSMGAGTLIDALKHIAEEGMPLYRLYFKIILLILIPLFLLICRLDRMKEWKIASILGLFFSIRDLRALYALNQVKQLSSYDTDLKQVKQLGDIKSSLSEDALLDYLESPKLGIRWWALQALREIEDLSPRTTKRLIEELKQGEFTTAWITADVLGQHGIKNAVPALRDALDSKDIFLKGKAMIALVHLQDEASYERIREIFIHSYNPRLVINGAHALTIMRRLDNVSIMLDKMQQPLLEPVKDEILVAISDLCDFSEIFYSFLKEFNKDQAGGLRLLQDFLQETGAQPLIVHDPKIPGKPAAEMVNLLKSRALVCPLPYATSIQRVLDMDHQVHLSFKLAGCLALLLNGH